LAAWLLFCLPGLKAQHVFSGVVIDAETSKPLPYVHVIFPDCEETATITRSDGTFRIQIPEIYTRKLQVQLTCMGMQTVNDSLVAGKHKTFYMLPDRSLLRETFVGDFDYERFMIRRLVALIPENYPNQNERIKGVVTEKGFVDSLKATPIYKTTVQIRADKSTYNRKSDFGNVEVIDGETETYPAYANSWVNIVAGVYNVHRFDIVAKRSGPLQLSKINQYHFENLGFTKFDQTEILKLRFEGKDAQGILYINTEDTALVQAEITLHKFEDSMLGFLRSANRRFLNYSVTYGKFDGRYRLRNILYETGFDDGPSQTFFLENTFTIENFNLVKLAIPESRKIGYYDVLLHQVPGYIIDSADNRIGTRRISGTLDKIFGSLYSAFGTYLLPVSRSAFEIPGAMTGVPNHAVASKEMLTFGFAFSTDVRIYGKHYLGLQIHSASNKHGLSMFGYTFRQPLGFTGRHKLGLGLHVGEQTFNRRIGQLELENREKIGNRTLRAGTVLADHQERQWVLMPQLTYDFGFKRSWVVRLSASYLSPFHTTQHAIYAEDRFWFPRSSTANLKDLKGTYYQSAFLFGITLLFRNP
jgi:hypothetical protein